MGDYLRFEPEPLDKKLARVFLSTIAGSLFYFILPWVLTGNNGDAEDFRHIFSRLYANGMAFIVEWILLLIFLSFVAYWWHDLIFGHAFNFIAKHFSNSTIAYFILRSLFLFIATSFLFSLKSFAEMIISWF